MTEQEYIDATDLAKVRSMRSVMRNITPENSDIIDVDEFKKVGEMICIWEEKLAEKIVVTEEG